MEFNKKRAQGLPLNTIVIALLVVVVLVVIVLAFTTNIGSFNESVNDQSASQCVASNTVITTIPGVSGETHRFVDSINSSACSGEGGRVMIGISGDGQENNICCAIPN